MLDVLTAEDVRRIDAACEARGITTEFLMGNAGFAVAAAARRMLGGAYGKRVVVVCGKGNNAGDGLVAGRVLSSWGASVSAVLTLSDGFNGAAKTALEKFPGRRVEAGAFAREFGRADLVIDAIFGVGLSRAPDGRVEEIIQELSYPNDRVLSVDVPSGMNADTGRRIETSGPSVAPLVHAARVVTLGGHKPGLLFSGLVQAGRVEVADIGVPKDLRHGSASVMEREDIAAELVRRPTGANKRSVGTVLVVAGSRAMPGAAALCAAAAVHTGAGLTTVAVPESVVPVIVSHVPEVTTIPLPETGEGTLDVKGVEQILPRLDDFHSVAIGPGLSRHPAAVEAIRALVAEAKVPVILDADGINAFAGAAATLRGRVGAPTVVTPHSGELARLMESESDEIERDRLAAARTAAEATGCHVLLKGTGTVIASSAGKVLINPTGSAALAQGGTGDVLTGMLATLYAADRTNGGGGDAAVAAAAAWIHGRAGDLIAQRVSPHPASPSMLIDVLPEVLHEVAG